MAQHVFDNSQIKTVRVIERTTGAEFEAPGIPVYDYNGTVRTLIGYRLEVFWFDLPEVIRARITNQARIYSLVVPLDDVLLIDGIDPHQPKTETVLLYEDDEDMTW